MEAKNKIKNCQDSKQHINRRFNDKENDIYCLSLKRITNTTNS